MKKTILTMLTLAMMLAWSCEKHHSTTHYELMYNINDSTLVKEQKMGDTLVLNYLSYFVFKQMFPTTSKIKTFTNLFIYTIPSWRQYE